MADKSNETENLSRIKEILFGEDLSSIEERFEQFKLENKSSFQKIQSEFKVKFDALDKILKEHAQYSENQDKTNESSIKKLTEKIDKDVANLNLEIDKEKARFEHALKEVQENTSQQFLQLKDELKKSLDEIRSLMDEKINTLNSQKSDSKVIADLLRSMADKLSS